MTFSLRPHRLVDAYLSPTELSSAVLDGELTRLGAGYLAIDEPEGPHDRARSLFVEIGDRRAIICDRSAAWVWGWVPFAGPLSTCVSITARVASPVRRRLRAREAVLGHDEVALLDDVPVTTPLRTAADLARHDDNEAVIDVLVAALQSGDITPAALRSTLTRRPGIAHLRRARSRIESAITRC